MLDKFLNELQSKILSFENPINDYEEKHNELMEIQNILYKYEVLNNEITLEKILVFSEEDIKTIIDIVLKERSGSFFRAFLLYKPLIESFDKLKDKYGENFEAPQYKEALRWLNELLNKINNYINSFETLNKDYIANLKEESVLYRKYYNMFNGEKLIVPVDNFDEFNNLLNLLNLNEEEQGQVKMIIGMENIRLFTNSNSQEEIIVEEIKDNIKKEKEVKENMFVLEAKKIISSEQELINSTNNDEFEKYLAHSISSDDENLVKYQIVSVLLALHEELLKYDNFKDDEKIAANIMENVKEYIDAYKVLKNRNK